MTPKYVTLNDPEWSFYAKFCFRAGTSRIFFCVDFENKCVKTSKDKTHTVLSVAGMYARDSSFWQYKVHADIRGVLWTGVKGHCVVENGHVSNFGVCIFGSFRIKANVIVQYYVSPLLAFHWSHRRWPWMILNGHFTFVTMIILHILQTNSLVFIVSHILLPLYYQVKLTCFSGRRLTASMSSTEYS